MGNSASKLLEEAERTKLPSLPHVLIKLLKVSNKDAASFDTLVEIIHKDAVLLAKILSVANSPIYAQPGELSSLKQILIYLGLDMIKSIVITSAVQQFFSSYSKEKSRFLKNFWEHTLYTAIVSKSLAELTLYNNPEEAYQAGLLHDIGQLIFENHSKQDYSILIDTNVDVNELLKSEQEKYNITHAEIGAQLLEIWGLPDVISEATKYHHAENIDIIEAHQLVKVINLSSYITANDKLSSDELNEYAKTLFDLPDSALQDIISNAKAEVKKVAASMDIDIGNIDSEQDNAEEKQIQLAQEIRNISLTQGSMQLLTEDNKGIDYSAIQKSTMILFGLDKCCLFLYDEDNNTLMLNHTTTQMNKNILQGFEVKADSPSLIAESINSGEIKTFFSSENETHPPVIDKQIVSAFKTDGILCVPLTKSGRFIGVIVLGVNQSQHKRLMDKSSLLEMYSSEIASRVFAARSGQKIRKDFFGNSQQKIKTRTREIIHEVNNPLAVIRNYLKILAGRLNEKDPAQNDLSVISEEIDRVGSIILKCDEDFNNIENMRKTEAVDVNELITSMHNVMVSSLYSTYNIKSHIETGEEVGVVNLDKDSLKQILTNLIKNSVEAVTKNKEISIATRNVNINGEDFLEIEISDTGPGIPGNILENLYKPVTSTKGKRHSGLGLSIVKNLLDEMGGNITCKTGKSGTTFNIHFSLKTNNN
jgi:putative nucleotidyltransferase with HDIG domain